MRQVQSRLSSGLFWTALLLACFFGTGVVSRSIGRLFGEAEGLAQTQDIARWAALAALALAIVAAGCVTIPVALRGGGFVRRMANVVPLVVLKLLALGAVGAYFKIGTVGGLVEIEGIGDVTFAIAWLLVFWLLAILIVVPTTARALVTPRTLRAANLFQMLSTLAAVVTAGAMIAAVAIVLQATAAAPGGPPGAAAGAGGAATPAAQLAAQAAMAATAKRNYAIGGGLVALFALLALLSALAAWRARRDMTITARNAAVPQGGWSEFGGAAVAGVVLLAVVLAALQPFRFPIDNPPATQAAVWDSPTTADLVARTCMDCHSNEGTWPWYTRVAPMNWLTVGHVRSGRKAFNLSELDKLAPDRRASLGERMGRSLQRGNMPTADYKLMHADSRLTEDEVTALVEGFKASLAVQE
ncbi:MAG: heme-binding domain-containing protein [Ardenticatenales bacterium]|nr:heme-binding domain-containing protein [Ardenticatenales bacterium]